MKKVYEKLIKKNSILNQIFQKGKVNRSSTSEVDSVAGGSNLKYQEAKPFSEIPGPRGLPFIGTYLDYRLGKAKQTK